MVEYGSSVLRVVHNRFVLHTVFRFSVVLHNRFTGVLLKSAGAQGPPLQVS